MVDCATTTHLGPLCPQLAHLVGTLYKLAYIPLLGDFAFILDPEIQSPDMWRATEQSVWYIRTVVIHTKLTWVFLNLCDQWRKERIYFLASLPSNMLCWIPSPPWNLSQPDTFKTHFQVLKKSGEFQSKCSPHTQFRVFASPWFRFSGLG